MNKIIKVLFICIISFIFTSNINALCYDEDFNKWAEEVKVDVVQYKEYLTDETGNKISTGNLGYAYLFVLSPNRDDITMSATVDKYDITYEGQFIEGYNYYAMGAYTNVNKVTYTISVFGSKKSKCPNELIKKIEYTMEPYNFYSKTEYCVKYPEADLCKQYLDTKDVTLDEFNDSINGYIEKTTPVSKFDIIMAKVFEYIREFGIYIVVPFLIILMIYIIKIEEYKKKERLR